ncbi:MAG: hypothetical protein L0H94_12895 [Nitrospira sp.]|nr:hypothetical protein [Nitrospira sp.]
MLTTNQKKITTLVGLGLLWGGIVAWEWLTVGKPERVPLTNVSGPASTPRPTRGRVDELQVQLNFLESTRTQREMTVTPPRNIFAPPRVDASEAAYANPPEIDAGSEQARRQQAALAGLALFHYLGFVRLDEVSRKKGEMAVLTKEDDLHVVRAGETVEGHIVVKAITPEAVTLLDRQSRVEHMVLLSEEALSKEALSEEAPEQPQ